MSDDKLQSVLVKIEHLRKLAEGTHSPAEAETALKLLARLQAQHRLSEAEIQASRGGNDTEEIELATPVYLYEMGRISYWRNNLAFNIAALSGVFINPEPYLADDGKKITRYRVVGKKANIEMALRLFNHLLDLIPRLAANEIPSRGVRGVNPAKEAWCNGCVQGFAVKMQTERNAVVQQGSSAAIAILDDQAAVAERLFKQKMDNIFAKNTFKSRAQRVYSAEYAGYSKGENLSVDGNIASLPANHKANQLS